MFLQKKKTQRSCERIVILRNHISIISRKKRFYILSREKTTEIFQYDPFLYFKLLCTFFIKKKKPIFLITLKINFNNKVIIIQTGYSLYLCKNNITQKGHDF